LLEISIQGAKGVIFNVSGGADLTMMEINEAAKVITEAIDPQAKVIFGAVADDKLKKGEIKITVIAAGFGDAQAKKQQTITTTTAKLPLEEAKTKKPVFAAQVNSVEDDSSEWDVPAFIRKKMK
jgi:cell division protein FtsZ